jgi:hypothetical protein
MSETIDINYRPKSYFGPQRLEEYLISQVPALVLAQHLGRNLRFKGSPLCDRPRSNSCRQFTS